MYIFVKISSMNSNTAYQPEEIEKKWYQYWSENGFFHSEVDDREPYTIVIPPPNVTGELHMGHMLNNTIQDVLIRRARLRGYNACWIPGTDHASIATEAKVVEKLTKEGIDKNSISRDEFMNHAWEWTENYGNKILGQLKKLGASCDWDRVKFTMDQDLSESVLQVFIDLHQKGLIYKGTRMVNWDPKAKTTLSDEEIDYEEQSGKLFYINYPIIGESNYLQVATTRPETIFGDTALCVNPNDERMKAYIGKKAIVPIVNREVAIISDEYVDPEFGTGCLKITPAHAEGDYGIGKKHDLEFIDVFNEDGTLNNYAGKYEGKDRFVVRKEFSKALEKEGFLAKTEPYVNKIGLSERTKVPVEPRLSKQWFVSMKPLVEPALKAVLEDDEIKLFPDKFKNTYRHWLENIKDWNISRQLWWGHRIPVYYYNTQDEYVVAMTLEEALEKAKLASGNKNLQMADLKQDEDVLDTWFSSWLWPISVFDGIRYPNNKEIEYYYPTRDLVTGPDILFFWVARMIISGYEYRKEKPFENVYLTGLVRDSQRKKMSKSLGNSPDALKLIENYGADGVRVGLLLSSAAGNDLLFEKSLCQQGKNFANKLWNATKLIKGWNIESSKEQPAYAAIALDWFDHQFNAVLTSIEDNYSKYRISDVLMSIYKLVWDDFCSWLLESLKPTDQQIDEKTSSQVIAQLEKCLTILHPFMPFVTEEIWHQLKERSKDKALIVSSYPAVKEFDKTKLSQFEQAQEIIKGIRNIRKEKNIGFKKKLNIFYLKGERHPAYLNDLIEKMASITTPQAVESKPEQVVSFRVGSIEYAIEADGLIDLDAEKRKINEELKYYQGFLNSVEKKLANEKFVNNAPEKVVNMEKKKKQDAIDKINTLEGSLANLGGQ